MARVGWIEVSNLKDANQVSSLWALTAKAQQADTEESVGLDV